MTMPVSHITVGVTLQIRRCQGRKNPVCLEIGTDGGRIATKRTWRWRGRSATRSCWIRAATPASVTWLRRRRSSGSLKLRARPQALTVAPSVRLTLGLVHNPS